MKYSTLKEDEKIQICGINYIVRCYTAECKYYLNYDDGNNSICFDKINISKHKLQQDVLGYSNTGDFPWCKTLEDLTKFVNAIEQKYQEINKNKRQISANDAQSIINIACVNWKTKLAKKWSTDIVLGNSIDIEESFYNEMRAACTSEQHVLFDKIFGSDDKCKVGDYILINSFTLKGWLEERDCKIGVIIGDKMPYAPGKLFKIRLMDGSEGGLHTTDFEVITKEKAEDLWNKQNIKDGDLYFVRDDNGPWELRYATGKMEDGRILCYVNQKSSGINTTNWKYWIKAVGVKLPE